MKAANLFRVAALTLVATFALSITADAQKVSKRASKVDNVVIKEKRYSKDEFKVVNKPRWGRHKIVVWNPEWAPRLKYATRWQYHTAYSDQLGVLGPFLNSSNREKVVIAVDPTPTGQDLGMVEHKLQERQTEYVTISY